MRNVLLLLCLVLLPACTSTAPNTLTPGEKQDGWITLFDGRSTDGWHTYRKLSATNWKAIDGSLVRVAKGGDLLTNARYENFILDLDWKIPPKGNSGVLYRADESDPPTWHVAPEVQILDDFSHPGTDLHAAGACYDLYGPTTDMRKSAGTWNHFRIVCDGPHITHYFNGTMICDYTIGSADWNQRIANSKFKTHPRFASLRTGEIALQDHDGAVEFRNIKLKPLP
jgi:hypothetical protein